MTMHLPERSSRFGEIQVPCQKIYLILLAVFFNCFLKVFGTDCTVPSDNVDILKPLKPLEGRKDQVKLYDADGKNYYLFEIGICVAVNASGSSVFLQNGSISFGGYKNARASGNTNYIQLTYEENADPSGKCNETGRSAELLFICDPNTDFGHIQVLQKYRKEILCSYTFEVGSRYACVVKEGLSSGSIFCILFFTGVSLYLLLGFLYQRLLVGAKGLEQIPNYSFWRDFGNLQADGCDFVCRCGPRQESHSYRGIDERLPRDDERDDQLLNM